MARDTRRDFLKAAAAATLGASVPAHAQAAGSSVSSGTTGRPADLILKNGNIITVDAGFSIAEAVALAGERIVAVGPDAAMAAHTAPWTRVIDLKGLKAVYPSLGRVRSIRDIQDRIADLARGKKPGEWIVTMPIGDPPYYFDVPGMLAEKRWPTRQELDAAAPNNPVYIRSIWGFWRHSPPLVSCANTEALKRAAITRDTVSPVKSLVIEKDANGDPTGVFVEDGMQPTAELLWFRKATAFSRADRARTLPLAARAYHAFGTTGIYEEHGAATELLRAYQDARRDGTLTMRSSLAFSPNWKTAGKDRKSTR